METETLTVFESRVPTKDPVGQFRMQCGEDNESIARQLKRKKDGEQFWWGFSCGQSAPICMALLASNVPLTGAWKEASCGG